MDRTHPGDRKGYFSYLLRLWRASEDAGTAWRASLRRPGTEEAMGFANLDELFAYLRAETAGQQPEAAARTDDGERGMRDT